MLEKIRNIFLYNGFEPQQIRPIRHQLIETTIDGFKKLSMGMGILYFVAALIEKTTKYKVVDLSYLMVFTIFLLMINLYKHVKNDRLGEFAVSFFVVAVLCIAMYESTFLRIDSAGIYFPIMMILIAVTFTGNPLGIDFIMFVMSVIYMWFSYKVKSYNYFWQDHFTGVFILLISNMMNAMTSRARISNIIKTQEIEDSKNQYKTLYQSVPCSIMEFSYIDGEMKLLNVNETQCQLCGYSREELFSMSKLEFEGLIHEEDRETIRNCIANLKKLGDKGRCEYRSKCKDGSYVWVVGMIQITEERNGHMKMLAAWVDEDARKRAIDANEAKSVFLSRMSHDIRTPMNAIIGLTDIVLDDPELAPYTREKMNSIKSSSKFLLGLINDVLDVSKIEANQMELHPEPYLREEFVNYLNTMIRPLCEKKGIDFIVDTEKTSYPYVLLDKVRFNQVFFNLLSNAVKYTPKGGTVTISIEHISEGDKKVKEHIVVSDTGIGMSKKFQEHMFDPFSQEDNKHVNESQGSGLGLAIVKRVIELMDGEIVIESEPGKGTRYDIYLNMELCDAPEDEQINVDIRSLMGKRVLLCEDHPINQEITKVLLKKVGIDVEVANDGREGVDTFLKSKPGYYSAVLMDIRMPNLGGLEASKEIRQSHHKNARTIPIIAMTANVFDTDQRASIEAGMNAHIAKPIDAQMLYRTLAEFVS